MIQIGRGNDRRTTQVMEEKVEGDEAGGAREQAAADDTVGRSFLRYTTLGLARAKPCSRLVPASQEVRTVLTFSSGWI